MVLRFTKNSPLPVYSERMHKTLEGNKVYYRFSHNVIKNHSVPEVKSRSRYLQFTASIHNANQVLGLPGYASPLPNNDRLSASPSILIFPARGSSLVCKCSDALFMC